MRSKLHQSTCACVCTQRSVFIQVCHFPPAMWRRTVSAVSVLHSAFTCTHKIHTHTAVIMCVLLSLFNLDGIFHLQAAITAGCLIVWVRLMGMCASVCMCVCVLACMHFQFVFPQSACTCIFLQLFVCLRADIFLSDASKHYIAT